MGKKQYIVIFGLIVLLFLCFLYHPQIKSDSEGKEAIAQEVTLAPSELLSPSSSDSSVSDYIQKTEADKQEEACIKSLDEYVHIRNIYNEFARDHAYLGVTISEDYVKEGDISPCFILFIYGKEDWCVQTCLNTEGMVSFGVTMPLSITCKEETMDQISMLLSKTCQYYGNNISSDIIRDFIIKRAEEGNIEKTATLNDLDVNVDIEDDYITVNFQLK